MPEFNRRQLFKLRLGDLTREVGKAAASHRRQTTGDGDRGDHGDHDERFARPPGALPDETAFLETCERCHACAQACPYDAIDQFGAAFGRLEGTPFLDPGATPCHWCEDMPCIEACPSDALRRDPDTPVPPIASVTLDLDKCLNAQGILCDTCSYRCPADIRAIRMVGRMPVLDTDRCTGCGLCVYHCEAQPSAFKITHLDHQTTR